jgi:hypothetical protein
MDLPINGRVGLWFYSDSNQRVEADIAEFSVVPHSQQHPSS